MNKSSFKIVRGDSFVAMSFDIGQKQFSLPNTEAKMRFLEWAEFLGLYIQCKMYAVIAFK